MCTEGEATPVPFPSCWRDPDDRMCIDGDSYAPCGAEYCYGACECVGRCPCDGCDWVNCCAREDPLDEIE